MTKNELLHHVKEVQTTVGGWTSHAKALLLAETIYDNKLTTGLEIGVYLGGSLIPATIAMQAVSPNAYMTGVDPWSAQASVVGQDETNAEWWGKLDHDAIYNEFINKITEANVIANIKLYRMTNREAYLLLKDQKFDYLNIDGNHSAEEAVWDVEHYFPLLQPNGFLWFDDIVWQGQSKAYELLITLGVKEVAKVDTGVLVQKV